MPLSFTRSFWFALRIAKLYTARGSGSRNRCRADPHGPCTPPNTDDKLAEDAGQITTPAAVRMRKGDWTSTRPAGGRPAVGYCEPRRCCRSQAERSTDRGRVRLQHLQLVDTAGEIGHRTPPTANAGARTDHHWPPTAGTSLPTRPTEPSPGSAGAAPVLEPGLARPLRRTGPPRSRPRRDP